MGMTTTLQLHLQSMNECLRVSWGIIKAFLECVCVCCCALVYHPIHTLVSHLPCCLRAICYFESTCRRREMRSDDNITAGIQRFSTVTFLARTRDEMAGRRRAPWKQEFDKISCCCPHFSGLCIWNCVSAFTLVVPRFVNASKDHTFQPQ